MNNSDYGGKQKGAALVVVLILTSVSLAIGLSSSRISQLDETLAGNHRAMSRAQMGAEHAASTGFIEIFPATTFITVSDEEHDQLLSFGDFSSLASAKDGECENGVSCVYEYVRISRTSGQERPYGKPDGRYIVSIGAIEDSQGNIIAQSQPVFVELDRTQGFGGLSSALTIFGGIQAIHEANNPNQTVQWLPSSRNAEIRGGELDNGESITSIFYEGMSFNISTITGNNPIVGDVDYAGDADVSSMLFLDWLITSASEAAGESNSVTNFIYEVGPGSNSDISSYLVGNSDECNSSNTYFAVVENYTSQGNGKFCGVLISLGDEATLGGTVSIDGVFIAANPESGFDSPSGIVDVTFSGGGGKGNPGERGGSVRFKEDAVRLAFEGLGLNYLDYMSGSMSTTFGSYALKRWQ